MICPSPSVNAIHGILQSYTDIVLTYNKMQGSECRASPNKVIRKTYHLLRAIHGQFHLYVASLLHLHKTVLASLFAITRSIPPLLLYIKKAPLCKIIAERAPF